MSNMETVTLSEERGGLWKLGKWSCSESLFDLNHSLGFLLDILYSLLSLFPFPFAFLAFLLFPFLEEIRIEIYRPQRTDMK